MLISTVKKIFGTRNDRELKRMGKVVARINALEEATQALDDDALRAKTEEFRSRLSDGETLAQLLPEAFAVVREAGSRGLDVQLVRNGSRGMLWLEPLVEVETEQGRVAYGPVTPDDVPGLFDASLLTGGEHALGHGRTDEMPWMQKQTRLTFERVGVTDPLDYESYVATGGTVGLKKALQMEPSAIVEEVVTSGLRGRGGAGFPAGIKWRTVLGAAADQKYIACNADEGDSGTYSDRMCMEGDPYLLIEGMVLAGLAVGATEGYIYLRSEYPDARVVRAVP